MKTITYDLTVIGLLDSRFLTSATAVLPH